MISLFICTQNHLGDFFPLIHQNDEINRDLRQTVQSISYNFTSFHFLPYHYLQFDVVRNTFKKNHCLLNRFHAKDNRISNDQAKILYFYLMVELGIFKSYRILSVDFLAN